MKFLYLIFLTCLVFGSCAGPENSTLTSSRIPVASGPEDMVIDRSELNARLLISCKARREDEATFGEILSYTPATGIVDTLIRIGTPDSLFFQPHGIFLDSLSNPEVLYAISHEHDEGFHPVYAWEVHNDTLVYKEIAYSDKVYSPNALTLGEHGEIYIVNDCGTRGRMIEKILKMKKANIVRMTKQAANKWDAEIVAEKLGYPAGINRLGNTLYAGDAVLNKLHVYTIEGDRLTEEEPIKDLTGNDNIRIIGDKIFLAGHVKPFKFISHAKSRKKLSPVKVWEINSQTREIKPIFYTDGSLISAGSTAVMLDGVLYVCQVFEPYILEVAWSVKR